MKKQRTKNYLILMLAIFVVWIPICVIGMNRALLGNAQLSGVEIARRFAANEMNHNAENEVVLDTLEIGLRPANRPEDIEGWLQEYLDYISGATEVEDKEVYASIDGKIVAATPWEGDESVDPAKTEWYQKAIEAGGKIIYTDAYTDVRLQTTVITMAKQIEGTKDVVALDIYPRQFNIESTMKGMPDRCNYFLSDSSGKLIYYIIQEGASQNVQPWFDRLFSEIREGVHDSYHSSVTGLDGLKRGVYYYRLESGMYSVITIPYEELLKGTVPIQRMFAAMLLTFLAVVGIFIVRARIGAKKEQLYDDILRVLGNSYYALYLIDLKTEEYSMLKGSDHIRRKLEQTGKYRELLQTISEILDEEFYQDFAESFSIENMRRLVKKRVRNFGGDIRRKFNGEYRWVHVQMLYDESLQNNKVVLCFKDVNEAKKQDLSRMKLLKDSLESVEKMAESKNLFFSSMSHDMRTPLNGIIGLARLSLERDESREHMKNSMNKILLLANQLLELINDILEISKIEQGKLEISGYDFNLKECLEEQLSVFKMQAESEHKEFISEFHVENVCVKGDWRRIQQILNNLLSNAFKFTKENGKISITVREIAETAGRYKKYQFIVSDTGTGMSREFLKKIYEPFERETRFGAANVSGTGLGMAIVHNLVLQMAGTIEIESELGQGSTFTVTLPFLPGAANAGKKEQEKKEAIDLSGYRVLLAEDNEINMEISTEILKMYHLDVTQAWNGKEAVELFDEKGEGFFDIILMDMQMPVMNGCEAARQIRAMKRADAATIPIIAVTANAFSEDIAATRNAGMNAHISKPIDFEIFRKTVEGLLMERREKKDSEKKEEPDKTGEGSTDEQNENL